MQKISQIQYLRAIAALLVVACHAPEYLSPLNPNFKYFAYGRYGVDIFFVVSGFIMGSMRSSVDRGDFIVKRLIRIVPLYWVVTLVVAISRRSSVISIYDTNSLISSLLFFPAYSIEHPGHVWPVYVPGWTLNYEIFFYLVFFVFISLKPALRMLSVAMTFLSLIMLGHIFSYSDAAFKMYTSSIFFEFIVGMWVAVWYGNGNGKYYNFYCIVVLSCFIAFVSAILLYFKCDSVYVSGLGAGFFVVTSLYFMRSVSWRWLEYVGDASYSIYLMQIFVLVFARFVWGKMGFSSVLNLSVWAYVLFSLISSIAVGLLMYKFFEVPVGKYLRGLLVK